MRYELLGILISVVIALWLTLSIYGSGLPVDFAWMEWRVADFWATVFAVAAAFGLALRIRWQTEHVMMEAVYA